ASAGSTYAHPTRQPSPRPARWTRQASSWRRDEELIASANLPVAHNRFSPSVSYGAIYWPRFPGGTENAGRPHWDRGLPASEPVDLEKTLGSPHPPGATGSISFSR